MKYKIAVHIMHQGRKFPVLCPETIWENTEKYNSFSHWCTEEFELDLSDPEEQEVSVA